LKKAFLVDRVSVNAETDILTYVKYVENVQMNLGSLLAMGYIPKFKVRKYTSYFGL